MDDNTIMLILAFVGAMIPIISIFIKLNTTITKLNTTMENLVTQMTDSKKDRTTIHNQLNNHETRISILEKIKEKRV